MRPGSAVVVALAVLCLRPHFTDPSMTWGAETTAQASTFVELSVAELVSKSTLVITGTPLDRRSLWEDSDGARGRRIVSYTRVRVDSVIDGHQETEVWVRTLGGTVDDIGQRVDGEAVLVPGAQALLFLHGRSDGTHAVVGMSQGQYPLEAPSQGGAPIRLQAPLALGRLLEKAGPIGPDRLPARLVLPGKTLADAAELIVLTRRTNAP